MEKVNSPLPAPFGQGEDCILHCPACGGARLHQERVDVFSREEDQSSGLHISVVGQEARVDRDQSGNPSPRRDGTTFSFRCEQCSAKVRQHVFQHKGRTCVRMEFITETSVAAE